MLEQLTYGRKARVRFICDCGGKHDALLYSIKAATKKGHRPSCKACHGAVKADRGLRRFDPTRYMHKRFGRLLVTGIDIDMTRKGPKTRLVCLCDCGAQTLVISKDLSQGHTTSCGCFHRERLVEVGKETVDHGHTSFGELDGQTPIYRAWMKIRAGCLEGWRNGAHRVCHEYDQRWDDFKEFYKDFGDIKIYETISRRDKQQTWCKANCFVNRGRRTSNRTKSPPSPPIDNH